MRKKILFIAHSIFTYGGEQRVCIEIMNALCQNADIVVITGDRETEKNVYAIDERIKIICNPYVREFGTRGILKIMIRRLSAVLNIFKKPCFKSLLFWAYNRDEYFQEIISHVEEEKPDIVVGVAGLNTQLLYHISKECKVKTIAWMHNSYEAYFETPGVYHWNQDYLFQEMLPQIDRCVVLNEYIAKRYKESFHVDCKVIYNPRSFESEQKTDFSKKQFIASGRMVYAKGFDLLIESFEIFSKKNKDWNLVILGDGKYKNILEKKVQKAGLEKRVILTGFTNEVKKYMLESSIFLLTSRWEGFPMVITEALEFGLPVIAYDITAMLPLVTNGVEGILVDAFDTQKYAEEMLNLAENKEMQQRMSANGIKKASQISIQNIVKQWEELFEEL